MVLSQGDEPFVVVEHLLIERLVLPAELIDAVGRLERVVYALFRAQQFLAAKHEGNALRGEHGGLCKHGELGGER